MASRWSTCNPGETSQQGRQVVNPAGAGAVLWQVSSVQRGERRKAIASPRLHSTTLRLLGGGFEPATAKPRIEPPRAALGIIGAALMAAAARLRITAGLPS